MSFQASQADADLVLSAIQRLPSEYNKQLWAKAREAGGGRKTLIACMLPPQLDEGGPAVDEIVIKALRKETRPMLSAKASQMLLTCCQGVLPEDVPMFRREQAHAPWHIIEQPDRLGIIVSVEISGQLRSQVMMMQQLQPAVGSGDTAIDMLEDATAEGSGHGGPSLDAALVAVGEPELTERLGTIRAMPGTTPQSAHQAMQEYVAEVLRRLNHRCNKCGTVSDSAPLKRCTQCKVMAYCGKECQAADWKAHKKECARIAGWGSMMSGVKAGVGLTAPDMLSNMGVDRDEVLRRIVTPQGMAKLAELEGASAGRS
uniref:MYND-type domain-containing protein n=1 Tax=Chlamydomonas leiostraca TaxID=1034604 RepID=A0A7S0WVM5_9CHLO|mmetsp:Transcript_29857/g.76003  ORF Transcript_29857/g.76003 Transcript_29857/m.76003 type:complete len:315 (+) Transcript_29857:198-1142(+)